jgi:hypothetical protein
MLPIATEIATEIVAEQERHVRARGAGHQTEAPAVRGHLRVDPGGAEVMPM